MSPEIKHRVCPVEHAGVLDFSFRKLLQNPRKILGPYLREGMTALDLGCGPGFFTLALARLVGEEGRVVAADLQAGMLEKAKAKIEGAGLAGRVRFHQCRSERIGLSEPFDFILVFYMLHEVPDQLLFLRETKGLLKPNGAILLVEPNFHVSPREFRESIAIMEQAGFAVRAEPKIRFSRSVVLENRVGAAPTV